MALAKAALGMKLTCEACATRFYDLDKIPALCPTCGAINERPVVLKRAPQYQTARRSFSRPFQPSPPATATTEPAAAADPAPAAEHGPEAS